MSDDLRVWQESRDRDEVNEYEVGHRFEVRGRQASFDFIYPRVDERPGRVQSITVGLEDVRAANDITIQFDFDRDGWVIESGTIFMWDTDDKAREHGMEEVAFIPAYSVAASAELDRVNGR